MAPRLRGSEILSSATNSAGCASARARASRSSGCAYLYGGICNARP
ncbi:Uncharacterised protein [Mycobacteroides abscessus subsp. abscessus]|nr:Uncharacterised protein [Mycobacteroides abscessus subsp. abscessus]